MYYTEKVKSNSITEFFYFFRYFITNNTNVSFYLTTRKLSLCLRFKAVSNSCLPLQSHRLCCWLTRRPRGDLLSLGLSQSSWLLLLQWLCLWLYNTNLDTWSLFLSGWGWGWFVLFLLVGRSNLDKKNSYSMADIKALKTGRVGKEQ